MGTNCTVYEHPNRLKTEHLKLSGAGDFRRFADVCIMRPSADLRGAAAVSGPACAGDPVCCIDPDLHRSIGTRWR